MPIKLVAIDLDDTLLDSGLKISDKCNEAIKQVQASGVLVTLATGRMFRSALPYAGQLKMDIPLITYQGALVKNSLSREILYYQPVPRDQGIEIMEFFKSAGVHFQAYFNDQLCMEALTAEGQDYAALAGVKPLIVKDLIAASREQESLKILAVCYDQELLVRMENELKKSYGQSLNITRSKPVFLEVMNSAANKGEALKVVAGHYDIKREEVLALGDSYNDLAMIEWAGTGVAMGNACAEAKRAADFVTLSNEEEGVAEALYRLVLNQ